MPVFRVLDDALEVRHRHEVLRAEAWGTDGMPTPPATPPSPYIHEHLRIASAEGTPLMRPLFVDFPQDEASWGIEDQFLFGPDILVAPVTEPGARGREVYVPAGRTWTDAWTGRDHEGGRTLTVEAPIERIPVFTTHGTDLPLKETE
ncbi:alpha-amylase family protein [Streptomyces albicerus]|uniref:TIM-barrel domain-containing protein n=1 Tax=Streptomyces albicerus TaxID=2569859 RepID=UPI00124B883C|nr:TIM-barrel domain-containing protein [Streptomyces albicerus]